MSHAREFPVALRTSISTPAASALAELRRALSRTEQKPGAVCLSLHLEDLHAPVRATISVPISVNIETTSSSALKLTIQPVGQSTLFPRFHGAIDVVETPQRQCEIRLEGAYSVPMGLIGETIDSTFLRGSAVAGLTEFLRRIGSEIEQTVKQDEIAHARAALHQHV